MSRFSRLPVEAISDSRLGLRHIKVLASLWVYAHPDGTGCHPTHGQISEMCGIREKDISIITADLRDFGWLDKNGNGGRSSSATYTLKTTPENRVVEKPVNHPIITELTTPESGEDKRKETTPESRNKPPQNHGINHPRITELTTPESGVRNKEPSKSPITAQQQPSYETPLQDEKSVVKIEPAKAAKKSQLTPEMREACSKTWEAYSVAYQDRYGAEPVKNAKVAGQVVSFVKRVGQQEAPHIAGFFLTHSGRWYVQVAHSVDTLLKDAEKLRMEWATSRKVTSASAANADRQQAAGEAVNDYMQRLEKRYGAA